MYVLRTMYGGKVTYWVDDPDVAEWHEDRRFAKRMTYRRAWKTLLNLRCSDGTDDHAIGMATTTKIVRMKRRVKP